MGRLFTGGVGLLAENREHGPIDPYERHQLAGIWFLGIGLLIRSERRMLGYFTVVLGFLLLLNGLGVLVEHDVLTLIGLTGNLLLAPLWALWLGITLLRWRLRLARGDDAVRST